MLSNTTNPPLAEISPWREAPLAKLPSASVLASIRLPSVRSRTKTRSVMVSTGAGLPVSARPVAVPVNATSVPSSEIEGSAAKRSLMMLDELDLVAARGGDEHVALAGRRRPEKLSAALAKATTSPSAEIAEWKLSSLPPWPPVSLRRMISPVARSLRKTSKVALSPLTKLVELLAKVTKRPSADRLANNDTPLPAAPAAVLLAIVGASGR